MPELQPAPLKTVFILPSFSAGGAERVLIMLMNGLDREKFAPEMICLNKGGALRDLVAADIPVHTGDNFTSVRRGLPWLLRTLRRLRPAVAVSTMAHMNFGLLLLRPFLPGSTRIVVREAITPDYFDDHRSRMLIHGLYRALYPFAQTVVCPAQCIIDAFTPMKGMKTGNFRLLYNPVNVATVRVPAESPRTDSALRFVCAGRLHRQKGYDRLIEGLKNFAAPHGWTLTIYGEGEERAALQAQIDAAGLTGRVTLAGFNAAPWREMAAADCFLLPSRHEGLPNVALEALCTGTPVIAMREAGGIAEIAALAAPGAVTLCGTVGEMIAAMEKVTPAGRGAPKESLLPALFEPANVMHKFENILDQAARA